MNCQTCGHSIDYHSTHGCVNLEKCNCQMAPHHIAQAAVQEALEYAAARVRNSVRPKYHGETIARNILERKDYPASRG